MYLSKVIEKNLACNDEEPSGYPPTPATLNGNNMYLSNVIGKNLACNDEEPSGDLPPTPPPPP